MAIYALLCLAACASASLVAVIVERTAAIKLADAHRGGFTFPNDGDRL